MAAATGAPLRVLHVFVTDMDAMLAANGVRARTYGTHTPACAVVEVRRLAFPPCLAEIEVVARLR